MTQTASAIIKGDWGKDITWEVFLSDEQPPIELITAVFCVAVTGEGKIVLARSKRGWGMLGGHIEDGETITDALVRESQEEGGFTPINPRMFAFRKVASMQPVPHQDPAKHYPFPTSYLLYYWATTSAPITNPSGKEIIESGAFGLSELEVLDTPDLPMIRLGYEAFERGMV